MIEIAKADSVMNALNVNSSICYLRVNMSIPTRFMF